MSGISRGCVLAALLGCGQTTSPAVDAGRADAGTPSAATDDGGALGDQQTLDEAAVGNPFADGSPTDGPLSDTSPSNTGATVLPDAASCVGGVLTAQIEGGSVEFGQCVATAAGCIAPLCSPQYYTYMEIDCASPMLKLHIDRYAVGTWTATVQYQLPGASMFYGQTDAMTTIGSLGSVGDYVDGTVSAPASEFSGSFHACRGPDGQDVGH